MVCAIVMVIDLWSGLSVTLIVADAQMIGAIYGVKQARRFVSARNRGRRRLWLRVFLFWVRPGLFTRSARVGGCVLFAATLCLIGIWGSETLLLQR